MRTVPIIFHRDSSLDSGYFTPYFHLHENIEILFIRKGSGFVFCENEYIPVKENNTVIINSNMLHGFSAKGLLEYDCFIPDRNFLCENGLDTNTVYFTPFLENDGFIKEQFDSLVDFFAKKDSFFKLNVSSVTLSILTYLCRNFSCKQKENEKKDGMTEAVTYMLKNLSSHISLDTVAKISGYSKYHFLRKFKTFTGRTPIDFINDRRCEYAKSLLLGTNQTVKEIADSLGFESPSYFSKVFLVREGVTPGEFSKREKNSNIVI